MRFVRHRSHLPFSDNSLSSTSQKYIRETLKIACLLDYMLAQPFLDCLGYDILLRPGFPPFDLAFDRRTRQVLNKPLWQSKRLRNKHW